MHQPYEQINNHPADFRVKYRFLLADEGGRQSGPPFQGYRSDFWYEYEGADKNKVFIIHPEFEDENGNTILYDDRPVHKEGTALMWILFPQKRPFHSEKIHVGTKGYFMEGARRVAECTVIEILALKSNPIN
jgi:hypothetical protein